MSENYTEQFTVAVSVDPKTGRVLREQWHNSRGELDRLGDLPADIQYCPKTGVAETSIWYKNGQISRGGDKPAYVSINAKTGLTILENYIVNGREHRDKGPSFIMRTSDTGKIYKTQYHKNGVLHRIGGAASEEFNNVTGELEERVYCIDGRQVPTPKGLPPATPS